MLLTYGFALADNPHALLLFGPPELLAGCAMARPELFSPDVVELLAAQLDQAAASYVLGGCNPALAVALRCCAHASVMAVTPC